MLPTACLVNIEDPDKMLHYAAFHLGLHCLLLKTKLIFRERKTFFFGTGDFSKYTDALNILSVNEKLPVSKFQYFGKNIIQLLGYCYVHVFGH